jgi:hypothetical protein
MAHGSELPRRIHLDKMVPAELKIREASLEVEKLGADPLLTKAVQLLSEACTYVSDFVDQGKTVAPGTGQPIPAFLRPRSQQHFSVLGLNEYERTFPVVHNEILCQCAECQALRGFEDEPHCGYPSVIPRGCVAPVAFRVCFNTIGKPDAFVCTTHLAETLTKEHQASVWKL